MKLPNYSIYILALIFLISCNPLDKSILEDLSVKELKKEITKDSSFIYLYQEVEDFKKLNRDKIKLAKYSELTWQKILDFKNFKFDSYSDSDVFEKEYLNKYDKTIQKAHELINDYRKKNELWINENHPNNFVEIELIGINTEYYKYSGGVDDVDFKFRIKTKKGRVQQVTWGINPKAKINDKKKYDVYSLLDYQGYIYSSPINNVATGRYEASYTHEKIAAGKSANSFLRDYDLNLEIRKVRFRNKNISYDDFKLPYHVEEYIKSEEEKDVWSTEYHLTKIIADEIDADFISKSDYVSKKQDSILEPKFPLEFSFYKDFFNLMTKEKE
jgi:hypothetical protein